MGETPRKKKRKKGGGRPEPSVPQDMVGKRKKWIKPFCG